MVTDARLTRARRALRTHARPGGLGRGPSRHRADRRDRVRARDRLRVQVGGRLPARAATRARRRDEAERVSRRGRAGVRARIRRHLRDHVPFVGGPGIRFHDQARVPSRAGTWPAWPRALTAAGGRIFEHSEAEEFRDDAAGGQGQRALGVVRRHRDRDAQSARRHRQHGQRHGVPDQALAVYELRRGRPRAARHRAGRALLGHRRSRTTTCASSRTATTIC